jgi:hypothetical protein
MLTVNGTGNYQGFEVATSGTTRMVIVSNGTDGYISTRQTGMNLIFETSSASEKMRITSAGNVLIGMTTDTGIKLYVQGTFTASTTLASGYAHTLQNASTASGASCLFVDCYSASSSAYALSVRTNNGNSYPFQVRADGLIYMPNTYYNTGGGSGTVSISSSGELYRATSSIKYKENVIDYNKGLAEVLQLRPVYYNVKRKDDNNLYAGLIAEEIEELGLKEFVQYAENGTPDSIYYPNMIALLTKSIQELNDKLVRNNIN